VRRVTREDVIEVYELRTVLETHALRRNFAHLRDADLHRARALLENAAEDERYAFIGSSNKEFHAVFYALDHASLTAELISRCFGSITPSWMQFIREQPDKAKKYDEESTLHHWELLHSCENGSIDDATTVIERHLSHACGVLTGYIGSAD
ncbi:FCD domain-containing protein, partial [Roseibium sediminicola]